MDHRDNIEGVLRQTPIGSPTRAHTNNVYGLNHRKAKTPLHHIKQMRGHVLFTRPQLNLQSDNIRAVRRLYSLLSEDIYGSDRVVRCLLDPRMIAGWSTKPKLNCPLVDNKQAFIPILSNNLKSLTGWPDEINPTYTTAAGLFKEEFSMVDGYNRIFNKFDLSATYDNVAGNIIKKLIHVWTNYMSAVFSGEMAPYPDFIVENEIDYNTRIYSIVLDQSGRFVSEIAATGASFVPVNPIGGTFDYEKGETPFKDNNKEISVRWECNGAMYNDPLIIHSFNDTVEIFNPSMRDENRETVMVKINKEIDYHFNHRGYPRINPNNTELEWWLEKEIAYPDQYTK